MILGTKTYGKKYNGNILKNLHKYCSAWDGFST